MGKHLLVEVHSSRPLESDFMQQLVPIPLHSPAHQGIVRRVAVIPRDHVIAQTNRANPVHGGVMEGEDESGLARLLLQQENPEREALPDVQRTVDPLMDTLLIQGIDVEAGRTLLSLKSCQVLHLQHLSHNFLVHLAMVAERSTGESGHQLGVSPRRGQDGFPQPTSIRFSPQVQYPGIDHALAGTTDLKGQQCLVKAIEVCFQSRSFAPPSLRIATATSD